MNYKTLYDKIWEYHLINQQSDGTSLIYIDRHLVHEVTSPQAFEGLRINGRKVNSPLRTLAVADHNVPTLNRSHGIEEEDSRIQVEELDKNVKEFGVPYFNMNDDRQGIVHVIGPEQGFTQPGMTIVCGESHTATHGAFGALAFGIGTSEVEHVLATQTLIQKKANNMLIRLIGKKANNVTAKDLIFVTSISIILSNEAPSSVGNDFHHFNARSQFFSFGDIGLSFKYSNVISSGAIIPALAPASIDILHIVILLSMERSLITSPEY